MNIAAALTERFGSGGELVVAGAPGRVNLIGEHTDYNDGFVLPTIIGCQTEVALRRRADQTVRLFAVDFDESVTFSIAESLDSNWPGWAHYLVGLTKELQKRNFVESGFDLAVSGTVPLGAGLSSSAALEIAAAVAFEHAYEFKLAPVAMVDICRDVEHHWVGVRCGIMDQMACRLGEPGQALLIDCQSKAFRKVPLNLTNHGIVLIDTGVRHESRNSAYNYRRRECEEGVALIRQHHPSIESLRQVDSAILDSCAGDLPTPIRNRCRYVVEENARVLSAQTALENGDLDEFGRLMIDSYHSLRDLYEASHPRVDEIIAETLAVPGVLGSRLTGAGWGGCTVTLCERSAIDSLHQRMEELFTSCSPTGRIVCTGPALAAGVRPFQVKS
jgi:galactokinase